MSKEYSILEQYDYLDSDYADKVAHRYAPKIGLFMMVFSGLEHSLNLSIADRISDRSHEDGYQIIEKLGLRDKFELFFKLYLNMVVVCGMPRQEAILKTIKRELEEINQFRNILAHANWFSIQKEGKVRTKIVTDTSTGYTKFQVETVTPILIEKFITRVMKLSSKIDDFHDKVYQELNRPRKIKKQKK